LILSHLPGLSACLLICLQFCGGCTTVPANLRTLLQHC
jgi:hypothetical protein